MPAGKWGGPDMKRLSVPHQSADYIFIFLLIIEPFEPILTALIIVHRLSQCERGWGGGVGGGGGGKFIAA